MAHGDVVRNVEWALLSAQLPGQQAIPAGILLVDLASNQLFVRLLPDLTGGDEQVTEFWHELARDLLQRSKSVGGDEVLSWLGNTASHLVQLGRRDLAKALNPEAKLNQLYEQHVIHSGNAAVPIAQGLRRSVGR